MDVCVVGMWHLGSVVAACLPALGHRVVGFDSDEETIAGLQASRPPLHEPGLADLIERHTQSGGLSFSSDVQTALEGAEVVWIAYDTPVDDDDVADVDGVLRRVEALFPYLRRDAVVLISSQLIAGCTRKLQQRCNRAYPDKRIEFAYSPENLRLGKAIDVFMEPDRVVVGANSERARSVVTNLLSPFGDRILWMSVESAEMTKHALNAFLAMCVSFANEIAEICEQVGADAKEVERGLKSERRIGPAAYLAPGASFAGGTLARDVQYLTALAREHKRSTKLLPAIKESNDRHRDWARRKLTECFETLKGLRIAVLGLTYKPGTDTLRRSTSVELCEWLVSQGALVTAHDPLVRALPTTLAKSVELKAEVPDALLGSHAAIIMTSSSDYKNLSASSILATMARAVIIDSDRVAAAALDRPDILYCSVGKPLRSST
jgi:UDPglucose 6-dehydrogenase